MTREVVDFLFVLCGLAFNISLFAAVLLVKVERGPALKSGKLAYLHFHIDKNSTKSEILLGIPRGKMATAVMWASGVSGVATTALWLIRFGHCCVV